ncbi:MAG: hypothetical protein R3B82_29545 [Sandaracinaceae bacterium]
MLRTGESTDVDEHGAAHHDPSSTAECVEVAHAVGIRAFYGRGESASPADVVECLAGTAAKDDPEDLRRIRRYLEQRVKGRKGAHWKAFYDARHQLPGG